ncbi:MAG: hypothetical protein LBE08_02305 [Bifidobacteriaceae bacterium]|nr:hypothetical protein [Bifidobacteriaceae bacterium]
MRPGLANLGLVAPGVVTLGC